MASDTLQLVADLLAIALAMAAAAALVFRQRWPQRRVRRAAIVALCVAGAGAIAAWTNFGRFDTIEVDAPGANPADHMRAKVAWHVPFHFHEFFHYYVGAKYFRELGYVDLYDCTAMADQEIARDDGVKPRISGWVRDLDDVLVDKPAADAVAHCERDARPRFTPERWAAFVHDIRELQRLGNDGIWYGVVGDAGFNPPPSWVQVGSAIANLIPIRRGETPTFLLATSLDAVLLVVCFVALRRAFGLAPAAMVAVFVGASYIAAYGWNGGAFLRFTWVTTLVLGLCAMRRGRWALAGVLLAASACDRLFPVAFALGAVVPLARGALRGSPDDRRRLARFGAGFAAATVVLVASSLLVFGGEAWRVFFQRILRHGDVYYGMHIGLKKVLTWRAWVPAHDFRGHVGLARFHDFNVKVRATWASMWFVAIPVQLAAAAGAVVAGLRRRPYESALLCGVVAMFFFNLPANYYYVVLALVPGLLLRSAMTAATPTRRQHDFAALTAFAAFWLTTLVVPRFQQNILVINHTICVGLGGFLVFWMAVWVERKGRLRGETAAASPAGDPADADAAAPAA
jgi:hypothetical protein